MYNIEKRNFNIFIINQLVSGFIFYFITYAINAYVLKITGSTSKLAASLVLGSIPRIIFLQLSGFLSDRFDKKFLFVLNDIVFSLLLFSLCIIFYLNPSNVTILLIGSFVMGSIKSLSIPLAKTILPSIISKDEQVRANSYEISTDKFARTISPAISAVIVMIVNVNLAILISAVIYILMAFSKTFIKMINHPNTIIKKLQPIKEFKDGLKTLFINKEILILILSAVITQAIFHSFNNVAIVSAFKNLKSDKSSFIIQKIMSLMKRLDPSKNTVGYSLQSFVNLGGAVGTALSLYFLSRFRKKISNSSGITISIIGKTIFGLLMVLGSNLGNLIKEPSLGLIIFLLFISNIGLYFSYNVFTIYFSSYYQKNIPRELLGKFIANFFMIVNFASSTGTMINGFFSEKNIFIATLLFLLGIALKIILHLYFLSEEASQKKIEKC